MSTRRTEITIAHGVADSGAFDLAGSRIVAVITPAAWTAADVTFKIETLPGSGTYVPVVDRAGAIYRLTGIATATSECHLIGGDANQGDIVITGPAKAKLTSTNTASEADVAQGGDRSLIVLMESTRTGQFG
jgi:hypothetical protein